MNAKSFPSANHDRREFLLHCGNKTKYKISKSDCVVVNVWLSSLFLLCHHKPNLTDSTVVLRSDCQYPSVTTCHQFITPFLEIAKATVSTAESKLLSSSELCPRTKRGEATFMNKTTFFCFNINNAYVPLFTIDDKYVHKTSDFGYTSANDFARLGHCFKGK